MASHESDPMSMYIQQHAADLASTARRYAPRGAADDVFQLGVEKLARARANGNFDPESASKGFGLATMKSAAHELRRKEMRALPVASPGWLPDPATGGQNERYWDGRRWGKVVRVNGVTRSDDGWVPHGRLPRAQHRPLETTGESDSLAQLSDPHAPDPAHVVDRDEAAMKLRRAMQELSADEHAALVLAANGVSRSEIGQALGRTQAAVNGLVYRARVKMIKLLSPDAGAGE
jgi:RNA polymerase sigma factor (sigma-70 family)